MKKLIVNYTLLFTLLILLVNCTSSNNKVDNNQLSKNIKPIPPGTAHICGTIIETHDTSGLFVSLIKIDTVFSYGHSTPPIAVGTEIETNISENVLDSLGGKSQFLEILNSKKKIYIELKSQNLPTFENQNNQQWSISNLSLNK